MEQEHRERERERERETEIEIKEIDIKNSHEQDNLSKTRRKKLKISGERERERERERKRETKGIRRRTQKHKATSRHEWTPRLVELALKARLDWGHQQASAWCQSIQHRGEISFVRPIHKCHL